MPFVIVMSVNNTNILQKDENARGENIVLLVICLCAPIGWNWLNSFMKILFGGKTWPSMKTFFVVSTRIWYTVC